VLQLWNLQNWKAFAERRVVRILKRSRTTLRSGCACGRCVQTTKEPGLLPTSRNIRSSETNVFEQFGPFLQVLRRRDFLWRTETERIGVLKEANVESIRRRGSNVDRPQVSRSNESTARTCKITWFHNAIHQLRQTYSEIFRYFCAGSDCY
jgi:hypothetical protein